jgi:cytochrome oxidase assembly protein ShyY1
VYRFLLTPRWLGLHVLAVTAVLVCVVLGRWQLDVSREDSASTARSQPVVALGTVLSAGQRMTQEAVGRQVTVAGHYDLTHQLLVPDRTLDGRRGYYVLTPLLRKDGAVVPVRRGWVASTDDPALAVRGGATTVRGVVQPPEDAPGLMDLPRGQVAAISASELLATLPYAPARIYDGYIALTSQKPAAAPAPALVPAQTTSSTAQHVRWRNFSYGLQWWLFGAAAVFFWWSFVRNKVAEDRAREELELVA